MNSIDRKLEEHKTRIFRNMLDTAAAKIGIGTKTAEEWNAEADKLLRVRAAAPELLEVCKYAAQWYSDNLGIMPVAFQTVANELEAAISKAEGI